MKRIKRILEKSTKDKFSTLKTILNKSTESDGIVSKDDFGINIWDDYLDENDKNNPNYKEQISDPRYDDYNFGSTYMYLESFDRDKFKDELELTNNLFSFILDKIIEHNILKNADTQSISIGKDDNSLNDRHIMTFDNLDHDDRRKLVKYLNDLKLEFNDTKLDIYSES